MTAKTKIHTTNYFDTLIEVSEDTKAVRGNKPASQAGHTTIAEMQYNLIAGNPYKYTSDDILFQVYANRNDLTNAEYKQARAIFFSKGQACLRISPLVKTYGFGIHSDNNGRVALYGMETGQYQKLIADSTVTKIKAMRSTRNR